MGDSTVNNVSNEPFLKGFGASMGISAVLTGGFGGMSALRNAKYIKNAKINAELPNKVVNAFLKNNKTSSDIFTTSYSAAKNCEAYSGYLKAFRKTNIAVEKLSKNGAPTFWQKITNIGKSETRSIWQQIGDVFSSRNNAEIAQNIRTRGEKAKQALQQAEAQLKAGEEIAATKVLSNSLGKNLTSLFKEELLNPINLIYAAISTFSRIKNEAVPVFKEQGIAAGIKQTFISIGKSVADVFANAGFSAGFRIIGSTIGKFFGPIGSVIGGTIGDVFGTFLSSKLIMRLFGEDKIAPTQKSENPDDAKIKLDA